MPFIPVARTRQAQAAIFYKVKICAEPSRATPLFCGCPVASIGDGSIKPVKHHQPRHATVPIVGYLILGERGADLEFQTYCQPNADAGHARPLRRTGLPAARVGLTPGNDGELTMPDQAPPQISPWHDPIVQELHDIRAQLAEKYHGNLSAYSQAATAHALALGFKFEPTGPDPAVCRSDRTGL